MSKAVNVYAISRAIWEHDAFEAEPYTQKQAWAWLIGAAAYQEKPIRGPRGYVVLQRGEFSFALRFLAQKWLWDKSRVQRFMVLLKKRDMIRDTERDNNKVYFIINYNKFQIVKAPKRDTERYAERYRRDIGAIPERDKEEDSKDIKDSESNCAPRTKPLRTRIGDYQPSEFERAKAAAYWRSKGRDDLDVGDQVERFTAFHQSRGTSLADWPRGWQTWYMNAIQYTKEPRNGRGPTAHENLQGGTLIALERIAAGR